MLNEDYSKSTKEELQKKLGLMKFAFGLLFGSLLVSIILNIFVNNKGVWDSLIVPLSISPIGLIIYNSIKNLKKEIKSRGN
jgi:hypothetical protein